MNQRLFLSAQWNNLILINYTVPDDYLLPILPPGLELDRYQGKACLSLVAFQFMNTKVWGVRWPGHTNFNEINLRFYVKNGEKRGVCFIKEIVPQRMTALMARYLYNEPYEAAPIIFSQTNTNDLDMVSYELKWKKRKYKICCSLVGQAEMPPGESEAHFFKEHSWGFGKSRSNKTTLYKVDHPVWLTRSIINFDLDFNFADVYGQSWQFLNEAKPRSTFFALGSDIKVFGLQT